MSPTRPAAQASAAPHASRARRAARADASSRATCGTYSEMASGIRLESDDGVGAALDVDGVDEAYVARLGRHDERVRAPPRAEEAHAAEQRAVGDAGGDEDDLAPRGE